MALFSLRLKSGNIRLMYVDNLIYTWSAKQKQQANHTSYKNFGGNS